VEPDNIIFQKFSQVKLRIKDELISLANLKFAPDGVFEVSIENYIELLMYNDIFVEGDYDTPIINDLKSNQYFWKES